MAQDEVIARGVIKIDVDDQGVKGKLDSIKGVFATHLAEMEAKMAAMSASFAKMAGSMSTSLGNVAGGTSKGQSGSTGSSGVGMGAVGAAMISANVKNLADNLKKGQTTGSKVIATTIAGIKSSTKKQMDQVTSALGIGKGASKAESVANIKRALQGNQVAGTVANIQAAMKQMAAATDRSGIASIRKQANDLNYKQLQQVLRSLNVPGRSKATTKADMKKLLGSNFQNDQAEAIGEVVKAMMSKKVSQKAIDRQMAVLNSLIIPQLRTVANIAGISGIGSRDKRASILGTIQNALKGRLRARGKDASLSERSIQEQIDKLPSLTREELQQAETYGRKYRKKKFPEIPTPVQPEISNMPDSPAFLANLAKDESRKQRRLKSKGKPIKYGDIVVIDELATEAEALATHAAYKKAYDAYKKVKYRQNAQDKKATEILKAISLRQTFGLPPFSHEDLIALANDQLASTRLRRRRKPPKVVSSIVPEIDLSGVDQSKLAEFLLPTGKQKKQPKDLLANFGRDKLEIQMLEDLMGGKVSKSRAKNAAMPDYPLVGTTTLAQAKKAMSDAKAEVAQLLGISRRSPLLTANTNLLQSTDPQFISKYGKELSGLFHVGTGAIDVSYGKKRSQQNVFAGTIHELMHRVHMQLAQNMGGTPEVLQQLAAKYYPERYAKLREMGRGSGNIGNRTTTKELIAHAMEMFATDGPLSADTQSFIAQKVLPFLQEAHKKKMPQFTGLVRAEKRKFNAADAAALEANLANIVSPELMASAAQVTTSDSAQQAMRRARSLRDQARKAASKVGFFATTAQADNDFMAYEFGSSPKVPTIVPPSKPPKPPVIATGSSSPDPDWFKKWKKNELDRRDKMAAKVWSPQDPDESIPVDEWMRRENHRRSRMKGSPPTRPGVPILPPGSPGGKPSTYGLVPLPPSGYRVHASGFGYDDPKTYGLLPPGFSMPPVYGTATPGETHKTYKRRGIPGQNLPIEPMARDVYNMLPMGTGTWVRGKAVADADAMNTMRKLFIGKTLSSKEASYFLDKTGKDLMPGFSLDSSGKPLGALRGDLSDFQFKAAQQKPVLTKAPVFGERFERMIGAFGLSTDSKAGDLARKAKDTVAGLGDGKVGGFFKDTAPIWSTLGKGAGIAGKVAGYGFWTSVAAARSLGESALSAPFRAMRYLSEQAGSSIGHRLGGLLSYSIASHLLSLPRVALGAIFGSSASLEGHIASMTVMTGSASLAHRMISSLYDLAQTTPFDFGNVTMAGARLQAFGFAARETIPLLQNIADAVSVSPEGMDQALGRVTLAIGHIRSRGTVSARELNQLAMAGIPAWTILAQKLNISREALFKMVHDRGLSSAMAMPLLQAGIRDRFGGRMIFGETVSPAIKTNLQEIFDAGVVTEDGMNKLSTNGVQAWHVLSNSMKVDILEAKTAIQEGRVTVDQFMKALANSNTIGGFRWIDGMAQMRNRTLRGALSNLRDYTQRASIAIGDPFFDSARRGIIAVIDWMASRPGKEYLAWLAEKAKETHRALRSFFLGAWDVLGPMVPKLLGIGQAIWGWVQPMLPFLAKVFATEAGLRGILMVAGTILNIFSPIRLAIMAAFSAIGDGDFATGFARIVEWIEASMPTFQEWGRLIKESFQGASMMVLELTQAILSLFGVQTSSDWASLGNEITNAITQALDGISLYLNGDWILGWQTAWLRVQLLASQAMGGVEDAVAGVLIAGWNRLPGVDAIDPNQLGQAGPTPAQQALRDQIVTNEARMAELREKNRERQAQQAGAANWEQEMADFRRRLNLPPEMLEEEMENRRAHQDDMPQDEIGKAGIKIETPDGLWKKIQEGITATPMTAAERENIRLAEQAARDRAEANRNLAVIAAGIVGLQGIGPGLGAFK